MSKTAWIIGGFVVFYVLAMMLAGADTVTVCSAGCNYTTVEAALTADSTDRIVNVAGENFTVAATTTITGIENVLVNATNTTNYTINTQYWLVIDGADNFTWHGGNYNGAGTAYSMTRYRKGNFSDVTIDHATFNNFDLASTAAIIWLRPGENGVDYHDFTFTNNSFSNAAACIHADLATYTDIELNGFDITNTTFNSIAFGTIATGTLSTHLIYNITVFNNTFENITRTVACNANAIQISTLSPPSWNINSFGANISFNRVTNVHNGTTCGAFAAHDHEAIYTKLNGSIVHNNTILNGGWFSIGLKAGGGGAHQSHCRVYNNTVIYDNYGFDVTGGIILDVGENTTCENNYIRLIPGDYTDEGGTTYGIRIAQLAENLNITENIVLGGDIGIGATTSTAHNGPILLTNNYVAFYNNTNSKYILSVTDNNYLITDRWDAAGYKYRLPIDAYTAYGSPDEPVNIPLVVRLNSTNHNFARTQADGDDIRFYWWNGSALDYAVENWNNTTQSAVIHVELPVVYNTSKSAFWMYYGNAGAAYGGDAAATFSNNYAAAWFMNDTAGNQTDATDQNPAQPAGGVNQTANGLVDGAYAFDGVNDRLEVADSASLNFTSSHTITALFYIPTQQPITFPRLYSLNNALTAGQLKNATATIEWYWQNTTGIRQYYFQTAGYTRDSWAYVTAVYNATENKNYLYYNDTITGTTDTQGSPQAAAGWDYIADNGAAKWFNGTIDHFTIATTPRSATWVNFSFIAIEDRMFIFGAEEDVNHPAPTIALVAPANITIVCWSEPCTTTFSYNATSATEDLYQAVLWHNGTGWAANETNLTVSNTTTNYIYAVVGNWTNHTWNVNVSNTWGNTSTAPANFTLLFIRPAIVVCGGANTTVAMQFCLYDEENFTNINGSMNATFWLYNSNRTLNQTYNFTIPNFNCTDICIWPPNATFLTDSFQEYDAPAHDMRNYFLINATISNTTTNYSLYLLNSSIAWPFMITLQDSGGQELENVTLHFNRYYPGLNQYITVAMARTSTSGTAVSYLYPNDKWFRILSYYDFALLHTFDPQVLGCDPGYTSCDLVLTVPINPSGEWYEYYQDYAYTCSWNNATNIISCTYADTSGYMRYTVLRVRHRGLFTDTEACTQNSSGVSGTLICNLTGLSNGTYTYTLSAHFLDETQLQQTIIEKGLKRGAFYGFGIFPALLLFIAIVGVGAWNPALTIVLSVFGILATWILGLYELSLTAIVGLAIVVGILMIRMRS